MTRAARDRWAARSFDQAVRDVRNPNGPRTDSAGARAFLSGSPMLSYWCEIAVFDLNCVIDCAQTLMVTATRAGAVAPAPLKSTKTHKAQKCAV
jgi:hypothetical protein